MSSSMTKSTIAATVLDVTDVLVGGSTTKMVSVHVKVTGDSTTGAVINRKTGLATTATVGDFCFILEAGTAPAVGDTFNVVLN